MVMWIKLNEPFQYLGKRMEAGETCEVAGFVAQALIAFDRAVEVDEPDNLREQFLQRLNIGANKPCLFLPFVGEFGHKIMYHIRLLQWHRASRKVVCCRPGDEVLYPSADEFVTDWADPIDDSIRAGTDRAHRQWPELESRYPGHEIIPAGGLTHRQEMFCIEPAGKIPLRPKRWGLAVDVCIGTRARQFMPEKNWPHAQLIADWCREHDLSYAVIGTRQNSYPLDGMACMSGDFGDVDAAIELLQNCRLFVGTDSGSAHLAATVGCRMFVQAVPELRSFIDARMAIVNPGRVTGVPDWAWDRPDVFVAAMADQLRSALARNGCLKLDSNSSPRNSSSIARR
jgi:hypothetical protein